MRHNMRGNQRRRVGSVTVELALSVPMLMLMMAGAADFARLFFHAVTLDNASNTGAFYGAQNVVFSGDYAGMVLVAKEDAQDLEKGNTLAADRVTATPDRFCDCPNKTEVNCFTGKCTGFYGGTGLYGTPRSYTVVSVQQTFEPLLPWPGIPNPVVITDTAFMRVR